MISRALSIPSRQVSLNPSKVLGIFSSTFVIFLALGCQPNQAKHQLELGEKELARGNHSLAVEHFSEALELDPRCAPAYLGRGKAHEGLESPADAAGDFQRALELQPELVEARERLMLVLVEMGNGRKALGLFPATPSSDLTPSLLLARGRARLEVDDVSGAILDIDGLLKIEPQNVAANFYRGLAHARIGKLAAAEADFTAAISLDAGHANAYWQRGLVRRRRGANDPAAKDHQKAAELDPRMSFAESQVGRNMVENLTGQGAGDAKLEPFSNDFP